MKMIEDLKTIPWVWPPSQVAIVHPNSNPHSYRWHPGPGGASQTTPFGGWDPTTCYSKFTNKSALKNDGWKLVRWFCSFCNDFFLEHMLNFVLGGWDLNFPRFSCKHFTIKGKQGSLLSVVLAPHLVVVGFWWLNHGKWGRPLHQKPCEKWKFLVGSCGKFLGVLYSLSSYFYINMGRTSYPPGD